MEKLHYSYAADAVPTKLLRPGHPKFSSEPNLSVWHELEADRLALLIMARWVWSPFC